ncbi:DinB family protein [Halobacillus sp. Marseille-Q1614]|uniref:DinB family protein n=1 Tax=Halobacillus sp. Marseille-Q1614 TaxID=2709134 RepID=UPI0015704724|nr:DinB family protein [Halobacillus sp. Marseille-Q1614]
MYDIEEKRRKLFSFTDELTNEEANKKPEADKWSILEILEHLYLIEKSITYQISRTLENKEPNSAKEKPINRTLNREYKVEAPEELKPAGQFKTLNEAREALKKTREALLFLVHNKDEETLKEYSFPHPAFGDLSAAQWVEFIGWHELRHLDQMKETLKTG